MQDQKTVLFTLERELEGKLRVYHFIMEQTEAVSYFLLVLFSVSIITSLTFLD